MNDQSLPKTLEAHGVRVTESVTTPSRPGKKPRRVWVISGVTFGLDSFFYEIGGRKYRGAWSFFNDPSEDILTELNTNGRQSFADQVDSKLERKEARIERFEGYSENAEKRSNAAYKRAESVSSQIPMGQPLLCGHHSEKRHRRDLNRIDSGMRKSIEESKKAEHYEYKSRSLDYQVKRTRESREYIGNRIQETTTELASLRKWVDQSLGPSNQRDLHQRIQQATERLEYWQSSLRDLETKIVDEGGQIASPETITVGDFIYYAGWLPVIRVNNKTVTVSHWLGVSTMTYKIEYRRIEKFRKA